MAGIRELTGWLLTLLGLGLIGIVLYLAINRYVFEAMALSLPGVIVFRAGIGLVRLAVAARVASRLTSRQSGGVEPWRRD